MKLYHFTTKYHLKYILETGLSRGDVPFQKNMSTQAVNLTTEGRYHKQKYNNTSYFLLGGKKHKLDKTEIRITVEIDETDTLFVKWSDLCKKINTDKSWLDILHKNDDNNGDNWYLYFGIIQPTFFICIEQNTCNGKWKKLETTENLTEQEVVFSTTSDIEKFKISRIEQKEFIEKYLN